MKVPQITPDWTTTIATGTRGPLTTAARQHAEQAEHDEHDLTSDDDDEHDDDPPAHTDALPDGIEEDQ